MDVERQSVILRARCLGSSAQEQNAISSKGGALGFIDTGGHLEVSPIGNPVLSTLRCDSRKREQNGGERDSPV